MNKYINIYTKKSYKEEFGNLQKKLINTKTFQTFLTEVDKAIQWYEEELDKLCKENNLKIKLTIAFEELFMNAYEHGNLGINKYEKSKLLKENKYLTFLRQKEKKINKKINVKIYLLTNGNNYIAVEICDEGNGFDFEKIKETKSKVPNGKGILITSKNGNIYYNNKGNCALLVSKCKE